MSDMPAWSFSSLNDFQNCPRAYQLKRVTKEVKTVETEAMRYGTESHLFLENRMVKKTTLPEHLAWMEPMMVMVERGGGVPIAESQMAISKGLTPTEWYGKNTWCRGIIDGGVRFRDKSILYDYKTGKRKLDHDQLMLFAALEFAHFPDTNLVRTGYVWLKDKKIDIEEFKREDLGRIWGHFMPKVEKLEQAYLKDEWPCRPSGLCGWCSASKAQCKHVK